MSLSDEERAVVREIGQVVTAGVLRKAVAEGRAILITPGMTGAVAVKSVTATTRAGSRHRVGDELLTRQDVQHIAGVGRSKSFEIWAQLDKVVLGGRCVRVRRADLERFFLEARRRAWR